MADDQWERRRKAAEWLRAARIDRGFRTATEFADALGWDQRLLSNYETGRSDVSDDRADDIARVLCMDVVAVRRGLGLWVPPDADTTNELRTVDIRDLPDNELTEELTRRLIERARSDFERRPETAQSADDQADEAL